MRPDQLTYLHIFSQELAGMSFALSKAQEEDNFDKAKAILVDMHINVANGVKLLGISREDFLAACKARLQAIDDQTKIEHVLKQGGKILLKDRKDV